MNAVRKPNDAPAETGAQQHAPVVAPTPAVAGEDAPSSSPVHALRHRIEQAFRPPSELATLRITTMVLVLAISSWMAVLLLLTAG
ncbi:hypothetical protein [Hyphomonas sp.]|uniref:hypothetical protein n=1 Tax=Hyphomonas sp. TaxID=87 RepID=UPI00391DC588